MRRAHNAQVAKILNDPESSDNDKYVALAMLRNAEVASKGQLPICQDTGTAIIHGEKASVYGLTSAMKKRSHAVYIMYIPRKTCAIHRTLLSPCMMK